MNRPLRLLLVVLVVVVAGLATADTGIPYVGSIYYHAGPTEASVTMAPDGSGTPLTEARAFGGIVVDATIEIQLIDIDGLVIWGYPSEDMWLQFEVDQGTATGCVQYPGFELGGMFLADHSTDEYGMTEFALPLRGGGWTLGPVWFYLAGNPAMDPDQNVFPPLPLRANSPDLTGDLEVNLSDVVLFTQDLVGEPAYRSDFNWDGEVHLSDIVVFTACLGAVCE